MLNSSKCVVYILNEAGMSNLFGQKFSVRAAVLRGIYLTYLSPIACFMKNRLAGASRDTIFKPALRISPTDGEEFEKRRFKPSVTATIAILSGLRLYS